MKWLRLCLRVYFELVLIAGDGTLFAFAIIFVADVPIDFLVFWRTVEHFVAETAALVSFSSANDTLVHQISLFFIYNNQTV